MHAPKCMLPYAAWFPVNLFSAPDAPRPSGRLLGRARCSRYSTLIAVELPLWTCFNPRPPYLSASWKRQRLTPPVSPRRNVQGGNAPFTGAFLCVRRRVAAGLGDLCRRVFSGLHRQWLRRLYLRAYSRTFGYKHRLNPFGDTLLFASGEFFMPGCQIEDIDGNLAFCVDQGHFDISAAACDHRGNSSQQPRGVWSDHLKQRTVA